MAIRTATGSAWRIWTAVPPRVLAGGGAAPHLPVPAPPLRLCRACQPVRTLQTLRSPLPRRRAPSPVLALTRSHAHYARDPDPSQLPTRAAPPPQDEARERQHELSEAARKATQAHSGPEGHQKEEHHHHLAAERKPEPSTPVKAKQPPVTTDVGKEHNVSDKEQTRRDWDIIKKLLPNVWPKNDWSTKRRVLLALGLLVGGKVRP
jgi:hypothetical protein